MANIVINSTSVLSGKTDATIDGINYSNIRRSSIEASAPMGIKNNIWTDSENTWKAGINCVDINWNNANLGDLGYINNTSDLLKIIKSLQERVAFLESQLI